jgi:hypothetical protein
MCRIGGKCGGFRATTVAISGLLPPASICFSAPNVVFVPFLIILIPFLHKAFYYMVTVQRRGQAGGRFLPCCFALLSSFSRWPHDQDRQLRRVEEAISDIAHHPAFQPMPAMSGDGKQVAARVACGSLLLCSWLCLAQQGARNVCFESDRVTD